MVQLIPDEMAEEFGTIGYLDEIGPKLKERWHGVLTTMNLPTDFPLRKPGDEERRRQIIEALHEP
jgi:hypothetical protein